MATKRELQAQAVALGVKFTTKTTVAELERRIADAVAPPPPEMVRVHSDVIRNGNWQGPHGKVFFNSAGDAWVPRGKAAALVGRKGISLA